MTHAGVACVHHNHPRVLVLFLAKHLAVLAGLLFVAAAAGTLATGTREGLALRTALGLALCAHAAFFLGLIGQLRAAPILVVTLLVVIGGLWRARAQSLARPSLAGSATIVLGAFPLFLLALFPPIAFDETLYHLPFVHAFARDGALQFLPELRFPVFPVLHEVLCVPPFLLAGDVATHLVSVAQVVVIVALLFAWACPDRSRRAVPHDIRAGWLAAAMFLGSPLVVELGTSLHVEAALALFVLGGFYALERERYVLAGFFFGSACSVKYLGFYFVLAALLIVTARAVRRRREAVAFALASAVTALPMTAWIVFHTGNPVFPFLGKSAWTLMPVPSDGVIERAVRLLRVIWDVTFARDRMGFQPPITPFLAVFIVLLLVAAARRNTLARRLVLLSAGYLLLLSFFPQDSRYLLPLLPLVSIATALLVAPRWPRATVWLALLAIAPGIGYAGYRLARQGWPPVTRSQSEEWLAAHVPEYRALRRAGTERVYVCGGERLKSYAAGELLGDHNGPWSYARVLGGAKDRRTIAERMRRIDARYFLVAKQRCTPPRGNGGMDLVYEDEGAQLWRVPG